MRPSNQRKKKRDNDNHIPTEKVQENKIINLEVGIKKNLEKKKTIITRFSDILQPVGRYKITTSHINQITTVSTLPKDRNEYKTKGETKKKKKTSQEKKQLRPSRQREKEKETTIIASLIEKKVEENNKHRPWSCNQEKNLEKEEPRIAYFFEILQPHMARE